MESIGQDTKSASYIQSGPCEAMDKAQRQNQTAPCQKEKCHGEGLVSGTKRDRHGRHKKAADQAVGVDMPRNAYTSMFEGFRDEIDAHHNQRERIIKASRDVTAASKNMLSSPSPLSSKRGGNDAN